MLDRRKLHFDSISLAITNSGSSSKSLFIVTVSFVTHVSSFLVYALIRLFLPKPLFRLDQTNAYKFYFILYDSSRILPRSKTILLSEILMHFPYKDLFFKLEQPPVRILETEQTAIGKYSWMWCKSNILEHCSRVQSKSNQEGNRKLAKSERN